jgi:hypothetical protein
MNVNRFLLAFLFGVLFLSSTSVFAQSADRAALLKEIESLRSQLKEREDAFLAPSIEDQTAFAEFLRQPHTGLIRLLPREEYDAKNKLTIRGGGAYYSFTRLTHEYGYGSDLSLEIGDLHVGFAGADYGMLANLGDISLDSLTLDTPSVQVLAVHTPPTVLAKARIEQRQSWEGMQVENIRYKRRITAVVNSAYLLRSINYDESDVLVAFRVVRKDTDGSLILAWKLLKKYEVPRLEREKTDGTQ